MKTPVEDI